MDKSKEYIEMSDCPEIQGMWKFEIGDYFSTHAQINDTGEFSIVDDWWKKVRNRHFDTWKWLPRQDQLQEMVKFQNIYTMLFNFGKFMTEWEGYVFQSMEQLWLAFVMKEKFGKVWKEGKWE